MKQKTMFVCAECGYASGKWMGKCPECSSWNSFVEEVVSAPGSGPAPAKPLPAARAPVPLREIEQVRYRRVLAGIPELCLLYTSCMRFSCPLPSAGRFFSTVCWAITVRAGIICGL